MASFRLGRLCSLNDGVLFGRCSSVSFPLSSMRCYSPFKPIQASHESSVSDPQPSDFRGAGEISDVLKEWKENTTRGAKIGKTDVYGGTMKWYNSASVEKRTRGKEVGHVVMLDDRALLSVNNNQIVLKSESLAHAIAAEWDSQEEYIYPSIMPLTRLTCITLDQVSEVRPLFISDICKYILGADVTLFRPGRYEKLEKRRAEEFDPLLDWFAQEFDCPRPVTFSKFGGSKQPPKLHQIVEWFARTIDDFTLTGLREATDRSGSFVIAAALWKNRIDLDTAARLARFDEVFPRKVFLPGHHDTDFANVKMHLSACRFFLSAIDLEEKERKRARPVVPWKV